MIPLSRPLLSDELWFSGLARHAELVGLSNIVLRYGGLVGNKRSLGSPLFPRQLEAAAAALDVPMTPEEIIDRHSMVPLYRRFFRPTKIPRAVAAIRANGNAEMALGLTTMEDYPRVLRMCPVCWANDRRDNGAAAWRRSHQAPGVLVCYRHRCVLVITAISCRSVQYVTLTSADSGGKGTTTKLAPDQRADAHAIAISMHVLLNHTLPTASQEQLAQFYRLRLKAINLVDRFDRLRLTEFVRSFNRRFGAFLPLIDVRLPDADERDNWLARLVRRPRAEQSPLRHVLLMLFLGIDATVAFAEAATMRPYIGRQRLPRVPLRRSVLITEIRVAAKRSEWTKLMKAAGSAAVRNLNPTLYSWLSRNDRAWLSSTIKDR